MSTTTFGLGNWLPPDKHRSIGLINSLRASDAYIIKLTIIGSDNGLSPGRRQAII